MSDSVVFRTTDAIDLYLHLSILFIQKNIAFTVRLGRQAVDLDFVQFRQEDATFISDVAPNGSISYNNNQDVMTVTIPSNYIYGRRQPANALLSVAKRVLLVVFVAGLLMFGYLYFVVGI